MRKLLMVFALATFALTGQDPAAPAPIVVAQFLGFSDAQGTQFQRLLQDFQTTFGPAAQQVMSAQQDLDRALESGEADPAVVGARLLSLRKLQKQLAAVVDSYHNAFSALLTPEQKQKVQAITQARQLLPAVSAFAQVGLIDPPR